VSRLRREDGALSAEFVAAVPLLAIVMAFGWQLLLFVAAGNAASHAARNGSRAAGLGDSHVTAAADALPSWLRDHHVATRSGERVTVEVDVPVLFPGTGWGSFELQRSAELPARRMP
jgi:hypothetical protein